MSQAVRHYFLNGGAQALIVRVVNGDEMILQATEEAQAVGGFDHLGVTVSNVSGTTFDLEVAAAGADGEVLADADGAAFQLRRPGGPGRQPGRHHRRSPDGERHPPGTGGRQPATGPPPERTWSSSGSATGAHVLTIGSQATATSATASLGVGLVLRATAAARARPASTTWPPASPKARWPAPSTCG